VGAFLYFVPAARSPAQALDGLRAAGAAHATEAHPQCNQVTGCPPFNEPGFVVGWGTNYVLDPDRQTWQRAPVLVPGYEGPGYWVGFETAHPPGPQDLARVKQLAGHLVEMGDGKLWLVPAARRWSPDDSGEPTWSVALPAARGLNAEGRWVSGEVVPRHRPLWDHVVRVQQMLDAMAGGATEVDFDLAAECEMCVVALAANYRVGAVEVGTLGLLTSEVIFPVIAALTDMPSLEALSKKAGAPGEASTSPGAEG